MKLEAGRGRFQFMSDATRKFIGGPARERATSTVI
jgi:hypothetical protein